MKSTVVNIRMQPEVKAKAEKLFSSFGITISDAVNLFISQSLYEQAIPFAIHHRVPTAETQAAFDETEAMIRGDIPKPPQQSTKDFFAEMRANGEI
jgi:DNA-damage-inducible protein J